MHEVVRRAEAGRTTALVCTFLESFVVLYALSETIGHFDIFVSLFSILHGQSSFIGFQYQKCLQ